MKAGRKMASHLVLALIHFLSHLSHMGHTHAQPCALLHMVDAYARCTLHHPGCACLPGAALVLAPDPVRRASAAVKKRALSHSFCRPHTPELPACAQRCLCLLVFDSCISGGIVVLLHDTVVWILMCCIPFHRGCLRSKGKLLHA